MAATPSTSSQSFQLSDGASTFLSITSRAELAAWLGVTERKLLFVLYKLSDGEKYVDFSIKKRNGGERLISAPVKALKFFQKKISSVLYEVCNPRYMAKGYVPGRGLLEHAERHTRAHLVVTADLKKFFPSINFGRVRGMFMAKPFKFNAGVATLLAQICCKAGSLPQGSPSSPAISNIICRSLDKGLLEFSNRRRLSVTRYADDICFSTNMRSSLAGLLESFPEQGFIPGVGLRSLVESAGFELNLDKFNVARKNERQMVTGLIVNDGVATPRKWRRQLRVLMHILRTTDEVAGSAIVNTWTSPPPSRSGATGSISKLIQGKAAFAGFVDKRSSKNYVRSLHRSYPQLRALLPRVSPTFPVRVMTEGFTDLIHLEAAIRHYSDQVDLSDVKIRFHNYSSDQGDVDMLATLRRIAKVDVDELTLGFFDFDNPRLLKEISLQEGSHERLGRMVFAACLSRPTGVIGAYCIESLYRKDQSTKPTKEGRQLFFSEDFDSSGVYNGGVLRREHPRKTAITLSEKVFNPEDPSVSLTLSKADFANMIAAGESPFDKMDFSGFLPTLLHLRRMVDEAIRIQRYK